MLARSVGEAMSDTPGVAQWAFRSIFNRQTPMSKYTQMKRDDAARAKDDVSHFEDLDDTFHYKRRTRDGQRLRSQDDSTLLRKKVSWDSLRKRSASVGHQAHDSDDAHTTSDTVYTLPSEYPGKFPKYRGSENDDVLLTSSATRSGLRDANVNMQRNTSSYSRSTRPSVPDTMYDADDDYNLLRQLDDNDRELEDLLRNFENSNDNSMSLKYEALKRELANELIKSQKLYDAYFRDVNKHTELKKRYRQLERSLDVKDVSLRNENSRLRAQVAKLEAKLKNDDSTLNGLRSDLNSSSKLEVTLRRKVKYLEDRLEQEIETSKRDKFASEEKVYLLEMKCKEYEEKLLNGHALNTNSFATSAKERHTNRSASNDDTIDLLIRDVGI